VFPRGKRPAAPRPKDFQYADFAKDVSVPSDVVLPHHPRLFGHGLAFSDWGMLGNGPDDSVAPGFGGAGDCVLAGCNEIRLINHVVNRVEVPFTGREAIQAYSDVTGYRIGDASTDRGTDMGQAAEYRRKVGIADANGQRHKVAAWVRLETGNFEQLLEATFIFLAAGLGFMFPRSAWDQWGRGEPWDYDPNADNTIDGGHYVPRVGSLRVVSWARALEMRQPFYEHFSDEAIVYVTDEELRASAKDVHGFDMEKLQAYLGRLSHP
jgi:hypothetical protein